LVNAWAELHRPGSQCPASAPWDAGRHSPTISFRPSTTCDSSSRETRPRRAPIRLTDKVRTWLIFTHERFGSLRDFHGFTASTLGTVGQITFDLQVGPEVLWTGIKWALAIGFVGGLYPAVRAARLPVTTALRES
jgi:hypothetical protein